MCGRYTRFAATELIYKHFGIPMPSPEAPTTEAPPSWNVAPQSWQPVIRLNPITWQREMVLMRWGLVPYWSKEPTHSFSTINARAEDILSKPVFREPMRRRRCLVPIDNYFEWQVLDPKTKKKQPWAIGLQSGEPFALAGIWDHWENNPPTIVLETYAVVTCEPSPSLRSLHDRMPVIVHPDDYSRWLEPGNPNNPPMDLLKPYPDELIKAWRVKPDVGNTRNDRPDLIDPYDPPSDPEPPPMLF
jgi:putative SOS response-associated peptidase YedK